MKRLNISTLPCFYINTLSQQFVTGVPILRNCYNQLVIIFIIENHHLMNMLIFKKKLKKKTDAIRIRVYDVYEFSQMKFTDRVIS